MRSRRTWPSDKGEWKRSEGTDLHGQLCRKWNCRPMRVRQGETSRMPTALGPGRWPRCGMYERAESEPCRTAFLRGTVSASVHSCPLSNPLQVELEGLLTHSVVTPAVRDQIARHLAENGAEALLDHIASE